MPTPPETAENEAIDVGGIKSLIQSFASQAREQGRRLEQALTEIKGSVQKLTERVDGFSEQIARHDERLDDHKDWRTDLTTRELPALHARMNSLETTIAKALSEATREREDLNRGMEDKLADVLTRLTELKPKAEAGAAAKESVDDWKSQGKVWGIATGIFGAVCTGLLLWWITSAIANFDARLSGKAPAHVETPAVEYRGAGK